MARPKFSTRKVCKACGTMFTIRTSSKSLTSRFCSKECSYVKLLGVGVKFSRERVCKICNKAYVAAHTAQKWCETCVPEGKQWGHLAYRYGIGKPQWEEMLCEQGGKCALCPKPATDVDHDHATGKVRALLCARCNTWMQGVDDQEWLKKAVEYKSKYQS